MTPDWTKKDEKRVRDKLKIIRAHVGGWQAIATKLSPVNARKADRMDRRIPHTWYTRGRVPVQHVNALVAMAPETMKVTAADLCPEAKLLESTNV